MIKGALMWIGWLVTRPFAWVAWPLRKIAEPFESANPVFEPDSDINPYLDAQRVWMERYGSYIASRNWWRAVAVASLLVAAVAVWQAFDFARQGVFIPYIVEVDKLGKTQTQMLAERAQVTDPRIIRSSLIQFIKNWRMVTTDGVHQKQAYTSVFAHLATPSPALNGITEWFRENSPLERVGTQITHAEVTSIVPLTDKTWRIEWTDVSRALSGTITSRKRYEIAVTIRVIPKNTENDVNLNPLGIVVFSADWAPLTP